MKIKLDKWAIAPSRAHHYDAGLDLYTPVDVCVSGSKSSGSGCCGSYSGSAYTGSAVINTGVHVQIPEGYVGMLKSKSGLNVNGDLTGEGVIDSGYTGSIVVKLYNHGSQYRILEAGDKIIQLVIMPIITPELDPVNELEDTERGNDGFGSTGR